MGKLHEIADGVVQVLLGVSAHRVSVARVHEAAARRVVVRRRCRRQGLASPILAQVLSTDCVDQPVDGVIGIVATGLHPSVAEENDVLNVGVVLDMGYVAGWIVSIGQVLHKGLGRREALAGGG